MQDLIFTSHHSSSIQLIKQASTEDEEQLNPNASDTPAVQSRRSRRKAAKNKFGDADFILTEIDEYDEAEWGEVYSACCSHSLDEILKISAGILGLIFFLYFYLFSLDLLGTGAKVVSGCRGGMIFGEALNPISAVMVASLATALLQSSSTTTSIVVALVSDGAVSVEDGVYLIMGANIGTSITNDIMALAQFLNEDELERSFGAACLHDIFNILTVCVLLPFEVLTGYLESVTRLIVDGAETKSGDDWEGPVEKFVKPLTRKLIISNKKAILLVAEGAICEDFYPATCIDGVPESYTTCHTGFVTCDKSSGDCPAWFRQGASLHDDKVAGGFSVVMALILCFICITGMMYIAQYLLKGLTTRVVYKVVNVNGYLGIVIGTGLTMILQSSSLTTGCLTPWVGIGVIRLEQMYPLTLGANIGTTLSSILTAMVAPGLDPLQVALAHLFFNITGVLIWYPIPHLRRVPIYLARRISRAVKVWRYFSIVWILLVFFLIPLMVIGISEMMTNGSVAGGAVIITIVCVFVIATFYWCYCMGGGKKVAIFCENRKNRGRREVAAAPAQVPMATNGLDESEKALSDVDGNDGRVNGNGMSYDVDVEA